MNVGLIIYGDLGKKSGGYLYDKKLVEHLRDSGHRVEIIGLKQEEERLKNIEHNFSDELKKRLEGKDMDILLEDELCFFSLFHLNQELDTDAKMISIIHHLSHLAERDSDKKEMYRYFEREYLDSVDGFIFNSEASQKAVENLIGESKGIVAHPGKDHFDLPERMDKDFSSDELNTIFIGNFCPHKCVDVMIRAVHGVENVQLTFIGDRYWNEGYGKKIDGLVSSLKMEDKVEITGRVEREKLLEELRRADVLLLPSLYEGF
ncbi:MAG: glycosyltransferase family 4 protein, partial [Thermoplasmata archaeon]